MAKFRIGECELSHGLFLAPMAGVTDRAFRKVCRAHGAEYLVSEMVSAKALVYEQLSKKKNAAEESRTAPLAALSKCEFPAAVQIFGSEPEFMAEAARLLASGKYKGCRSEILPTAIDINMGCPVHKIVGNGEGSALMKNPALAADIVRAVAKAISIPVTVKIRAGWDAEHVNAPELAKALEDAGAAAVCVHARTRTQMYNPGIDLSVIERVKNAVRIPVIGNGDIYSAENAIKMLDATGCDGIMIGRGAMGNPWIFEEIAAALEGRAFTPPTLEERLSTAIAQIDDMTLEKGERIAAAEAKKHLSWYIKGLRGAAEMRSRINLAESIDEMKKLLYELAEGQDQL